MYLEPIFLIPVFKERIWGGTRLREEFNYNTPSNMTGECWGISAHKNGQSVVKSGTFKGLTLGELWRRQTYLFGGTTEKEFPLLVKILDANNDLSVQVHPDDVYAQKIENGEKGKTECWYILDCKKDAEIIIGHNANTIAEFKHLIEDGNWNSLLRRVKIKPGDFFYVPSGTIHAIGEGTLILETQQSSDTTYRIYDYDRIDNKGLKRELHLEKAIDVISIPHQDYQINSQVEYKDGFSKVTFVEGKYFTVQKWDVTNEASFNQDKPFKLLSIINGYGDIIVNSTSYPLEKGDHVILPYNLGEYKISGNVSMIVSHM